MYTIYAIKKNKPEILIAISIIAFIAPIYSLYQTGLSTNWRFLGDGYWTRALLLITLDMPTFIILGIIAFNFEKTMNEHMKLNYPWLKNSILILLVLRGLFHFLLSDKLVYSFMKSIFG
jgi:hypothetical protein